LKALRATVKASNDGTVPEELVDIGQLANDIKIIVFHLLIAALTSEP
jgi:hypothetical protein